MLSTVDRPLLFASMVEPDPPSEPRREPGTPPTAVAAAKMLEIIDAAFEGVPDSNGSFDYSFSRGEQLEPAFASCSKIPYSPKCLKQDGSLLCNDGDVATKAAMEQLHLTSCLQGGAKEDTSTCKSFWATVAAFSELVIAFPSGPAFANYLAVGELRSRTCAFSCARV